MTKKINRQLSREEVYNGPSWYRKTKFEILFKHNNFINHR